MTNSQTGSGIITNGTSETIWEKRARQQQERRAARSDEQRKTTREYDRARYDADARRTRYEQTKERDKLRRALSDGKPFVGVDGEGINLESGYHAYNMLRAGNRKIEPRDGEVRLRTADCLQFLSSLRPDRIYVAFFFDYDVAKILEDLSWNRLEYLVNKEGRRRKKGGFWPVDVGEYSVDYLPRKELKVRKGKGPWITIHDVGTFFQMPFVKALELWDVGTEDEIAAISEGKGLRADFVNIDPEYVDKYNDLECVLLAQLMTKFRAACIELGYVPRKWQGPGLLSEAMLEKHDIPATEDYGIFEDAGPESLYEFAKRAFYGGRFETSIVGYTSLPHQPFHGCIQYDINSAYPYALQFVPCLTHGEWQRVTGRRELEPDELSISFGAFHATEPKVMFYGFPMRREDGSIHFPGHGKGWYWSFEAKAAIHQTFTVYDSWVYKKHCDCKPFAFLKDVYAARKRMGKASKGLVLKLAMNSVYGKMAQSIGEPRFSNPVWASFITAWCRTQIMNLIHTMPGCQSGWCGKDVFMIATDAVFIRNYPENMWTVRNGPELGQWDRTVYTDGLFVVQPGVYFEPDSRTDKLKTRGIPRTMVVEHKQEFMDAYAHMRRTQSVRDGDVLLPMKLFIGIRQALHRNSLKLLGQFVEYVDPITGDKGRRTSFEWQTKRRPDPLPDIMTVGDGSKSPHVATLPYVGLSDDGRPIQTVPYSKDIGGLQKRAQLREMFADQPDWIMEP